MSLPHPWRGRPELFILITSPLCTQSQETEKEQAPAWQHSDTCRRRRAAQRTGPLWLWASRGPGRFPMSSVCSCRRSSGQTLGPQRLSRCPSITRLAQVRSPVSEAGRRSSHWPPLGTDASPQTGASCLSSSLILVPLYKVARNATSLRMKSRV